MNYKFSLFVFIFSIFIFSNISFSQSQESDITRKRADLYFSSGDYSKAIENYLKVGGSVYVLNQIGLCYYKNNDIKNALKYFEYGLSSGKLNPSKDYANCLNNYANALMEVNKYSLAEKYFKEALKVKEKFSGKASLDYVITANNLADLFNSNGNNFEAEPIYKECINVLEKLGETNTLTYAILLNNLAEINSSMGSYDMAIELYKKSIKTKQTIENENNSSLANGYLNLATAYTKAQKYSESEEYFSKGIRLKTELEETQSIEYAFSLHNMAEMYAKQNNINKSLQMNEMSVEILKSIQSKLSANDYLIIASTAKLHEKSKNYFKADSLYKICDSFFRANSSENSSAYSSFLINYAEYLATVNQNDEADKYINTAIQLKNEEIIGRFKYLSEKEKMKLLDANEPYYQRFITYCLKRVGQFPQSNVKSKNLELGSALLNYRLNNKAMVFQETQKLRKIIFSSPDTMVRNKYLQWEDQRHLISKLQNLKLSSEDKLKVKELEKRLNLLEKELYSLSENYKKTFATEIKNWSVLKTKLADNEAALEIIRIKKNKDSTLYFGIIIHKNSLYPEIFYFPESMSLEKKSLKFYRNAIKLKEEDDVSYQSFWKPVADKLPVGIKKIYVSPDGVFHSVSLNSLKNTQTGKYLIEDYELHKLSNLNEIVDLKTNIQNQEKIELKSTFFGRPSYFSNTQSNTESLQKDLQRSTSSSSLTNIPFSDLPGTESEVSAISNLLKNNNVPTNIYMKESATEEQFKQLEEVPVIHIATHGYFIPETAGNEKESMLRSGIVLAGINPNAENDGLLTAYELSAMNLTKTTLLVLSACETGLGDVKNGEGVFGLQRAAGIAGAKSIIMSLWTVNDEATKDLMIAFYSKWIKSMDKRKAFREAQLDMLKKYKHPYYWSPFVMIGE